MGEGPPPPLWLAGKQAANKRRDRQRDKARVDRPHTNSNGDNTIGNKRPTTRWARHPDTHTVHIS